MSKEELRLADLFLIIVFHVYNFYATPVDTIEDLKRQKKRAKALDNEDSLYLFTTLIKNNAQKVLKSFILKLSIIFSDIKSFGKN